MPPSKRGAFIAAKSAAVQGITTLFPSYTPAMPHSRPLPTGTASMPNVLFCRA